MRLSPDFFTRDTLTVAKSLLGQRLVRRGEGGEVTAGLIVEAEAYLGRRDPAAHSYKGETARTRAMFGPKGHAYIYLIYGMYTCMNVVCGPPGEPEAVLIRALEPVEGLALMAKRRGTDRVRALCSGPGKLCMAMDISRELYGENLTDSGRLYLEQGPPPAGITQSKRINIDYAGEARDHLWRFSVTDSPFVSVKP